MLWNGYKNAVLRGFGDVRRATDLGIVVYNMVVL